MNRILTASALVALAALTAAPAFAASATTAPAKPAAAKPAMKAAAKPVAKPVAKPAAKPAPKVVTFKTLDTNKDGKLSLAEIQKVWPAVTKADFAKYDADKNGFFDRTELAAFAKSLKK